MKTENWSLHEGFISDQIDRLNHPQYFSSDFSCPDIDKLIGGVHSPSHALKNRQELNNFFDNLIGANHSQKGIFVRLKWMVYLHTLIQNFTEGSIMYALVLKALFVCTDKFDLMSKCTERYDRYILNYLFKPYVQYLSKLCLVITPNKYEAGSQKQNINHENYGSPTKTKANSQQIFKWYREYNFVLQTLQCFSQILKNQQCFFKIQFPYFTKIRKLIGSDLKKIMKKLKQTKVSLNDLNMTMIELDRLQYRICEFLKSEDNIFEAAESVFMTGLQQDCTKQDITNFMCTPLKVSQYQFNTQ